MVVTAKPKIGSGGGGNGGSGDALLPIQSISASTNFTPASFSGVRVSLGQNIEISLSGASTVGREYPFYIESSGNYTLTFSTDFDLGDVEYNHVFSNGDTATLIFVGASTGLELNSASRGES